MASVGDADPTAKKTSRERREKRRKNARFSLMASHALCGHTELGTGVEKWERLMRWRKGIFISGLQ